MNKLKILTLFLIPVSLSACSKHDPVLPGQRESIFPEAALVVLNKEVPNLPMNLPETKNVDCPYTQDSSNVIWNGDKKIFSGFPTSNSVTSDQKPVCDDEFVYAGLTTGELVKVNAKTRNIEWVTDVYRENNMLGGASVLDIVAPVVVKGDGVYVGGLGDAFCKLDKTGGHKKWCINLGVAEPFILVDNFAFVVGTNNKLYAVNTSNGDIYWSKKVQDQAAPIYKDKTITVEDETFDASDGKKID